jgi:ABC-type Fe3+-citrate transport system substrate-binding protein
LISSFVDTYLRLNNKEEQVFQEEIAKIQTVNEQEQIMKLTTSWMERVLEQGLEQERRSNISTLLEMRYGAIDEQLVAILPNLMILTSIEYTSLIFQLSKQELIEHFKSAQN